MIAEYIYIYEGKKVNPFIDLLSSFSDFTDSTMVPLRFSNDSLELS